MEFDLQILLHIIGNDIELFDISIVLNKHIYKILSEYSKTLEFEQKFSDIERIGLTYVYRLRGVLHRVGGPAFYSDDENTKCWYYRGRIHRADGPAMSCRGFRIWYNHGEPMRIDIIDNVSLTTRSFYGYGRHITLNNHETSPIDSDNFRTRWVREKYS